MRVPLIIFDRGKGSEVDYLITQTVLKKLVEYGRDGYATDLARVFNYKDFHALYGEPLVRSFSWGDAGNFSHFSTIHHYVEGHNLFEIARREVNNLMWEETDGVL